MAQIKQNTKAQKNSQKQKSMFAGRRNIIVVGLAALLIVGGALFGIKATGFGSDNAKAAVAAAYNPYYSKCLPDPAKRPTLQLGSKDSADPNTGYCVRALQRGLNDCCGQGLLEDGNFGATTKQAVINFQTFFNSTHKDGIVKADTWGGVDYIQKIAIQNAGLSAKYKTPQQVWDIAHGVATTTTTPTTTKPAAPSTTTAPATTTAPSTTSTTPSTTTSTTKPTTTTSVAAPDPNKCTTTSKLTQNSTDANCVAKMQGLVNAATGAKLTVDGKYGPQTAAAVLQYANKLCKTDSSSGTIFQSTYWSLKTSCPAPGGAGNLGLNLGSSSDAPVSKPTSPRPITTCYRVPGQTNVTALPNIYAGDSAGNGCYLKSDTSKSLVKCINEYKFVDVASGTSIKKLCIKASGFTASLPPATGVTSTKKLAFKQNEVSKYATQLCDSSHQPIGTVMYFSKKGCGIKVDPNPNIQIIKCFPGYIRYARYDSNGKILDQFCLK